MDEFEGIVISSIDYKEKSKIVYLYTPYGTDSILVKGAKKYNQSLLDFTTTLNEVKYIKTKSKLPSLIEFRLIKSHFNLTTNINKIRAIQVILYLLKQIQNDNYHNKIYNFVIKIINYLDEYDNYKKVLALYLIKMLYVFGINPSLNECVICKNKNDLVFFDLKEGGCYCKNHSINSNTLKLNIWKEYYYDKKEFIEYSDCDFNQLLNDIFTYYNIHMSINLNNIMN